jgi:hypothetical protein
VERCVRKERNTEEEIRNNRRKEGRNINKQKK